MISVEAPAGASMMDIPSQTEEVNMTNEELQALNESGQAGRVIRDMSRLVDPQTVGVIEADHYREEQALLATDPIIIEMGREIAAAGHGAEVLGHDSLPALREYQRRGGQNARSIGSVRRALWTWLTEQGY